jgi:uncharacterized protein with HEPN domain
MSERDRILLLEDMLDSALKIRRYTSKLDFDSSLFFLFSWALVKILQRQIIHII